MKKNFCFPGRPVHSPRRMRSHLFGLFLLSACFVSCGSTAPSAHPTASARQALTKERPEERAERPAAPLEKKVAPPAQKRQVTPAARPVAAPLKKATPAPPVKKRVTRKKVLILGDSMAATDFGKALEKRLKADRHFSPRRRGKSATGLARPDFFDWTKEAKRQLKKHKPDVVVVVIGGNDGQDLISVPAGSARRVVWDTKRWAGRYAARVEAFADLLRADGRQVFWLELPAMEKGSLERKLRKIRALQRRSVEGKAGVRYLRTRPHLVGADGKVHRSLRHRGKTVKMRQADGIHFTLAGAKHFAGLVYEDLAAALTAPAPEATP